MDYKLKTGRKIKIKDVSVDERDEMMDSIEWENDAKGNPTKMKMMHSTMTKWMRLGIDGDVTDKFIKSLKFDEKIEIFTKLQEEFMSTGEG